MHRLLFTFLLGLALSAEAQVIDYPTQIQPILTNNCAGCHSNYFSSYTVLMNVSNVRGYGTRMVVPGNADGSPLFDKIRLDKFPSSGGRMPNGGALTQNQVNLIRDWINQGATPTTTERNGALPQFSLVGNYPNPFNPATTVVFDMVSVGPAEIVVFNILGQVVMQQRVNAQAGRNTLRLDLGNNPSGLYVYQLADISTGKKLTRTMVLSK
jgi:hypothetical protein